MCAHTCEHHKTAMEHMTMWGFTQTHPNQQTVAATLPSATLIITSMRSNKRHLLQAKEVSKVGKHLQ